MQRTLFAAILLTFGATGWGLSQTTNSNRFDDDFSPRSAATSASEIEKTSTLENTDLVIARRSIEDQPRLMLTTGGPTALLNTMAFSADSSRLYTAGQDKVVQAWDLELTSRAIRRSSRRPAALVQNIRWEIARGNRGVVYALAVAPKDRRIAFAGLETRSTGAICIYDTAKDQVVASLAGHNDTIISLSFSLDGKRLCSQSMDGEIRVWTVPDAGAERSDAWQYVRLQKPSSAFFPQRAIFLNDSIVAASVLASPRTNERLAVWRLGLFNVDAPNNPPTIVPVDHFDQMNAIVRAADGMTWATSDRSGSVWLWSNPLQPMATLLRNSRQVVSMSFGPANQLLLLALPAKDQPAHAELWDVQGKQLLDETDVCRSNSLACAYSPNGQKLVIASEENNEILVYAASDANGAAIAKPLSAGPTTRIRGSGQKVQRVAFAADGSYRLGIGHTWANDNPLEHGPITRVFDMTKQKIMPVVSSAERKEAEGMAARNIVRKSSLPMEDNPANFRTPTADCGTWAAELHPSFRSILLSKDGAAKRPITLDPRTMGEIRTYCFIPDSNGKPFAFAIGTNNVTSGIYIYRLSEDGDHPMIRYLRDHTAMISSLSASKDGKYLASGSYDQTAKIWSLSGLNPPADTLSGYTKWGADFGIEDGVVVLKSIDNAGIAHARGLRKGDIISKLTVGPEITWRLGYKTPIADVTFPDKILEVLGNPPTFESIVFTLKRMNKPLKEQYLAVAAWEPLMTLFVDRKSEWACWTNEGYYESSVSGNELFGWHVNRGPNKKPDFFRADQFRRELERPAVMRNLLGAGSIRAAVVAAGNQAGAGAEMLVQSQISKTPKVKILEPQDGQQFGANAEMVVRAEIEFPEGIAPNVYPVQAYLNGAGAGKPIVAVNGTKANYQWKIPATDPFNRLRIVADGEAATPVGNPAFADVHVQSMGADATRPKLHALFLAAADYPGKLKLDFPIADAKGVLETMRQQSKDLYDTGITFTLTDHEITRESVVKLIAKVRKELEAAHPGDLLVVFLAGHGMAFGDDYYFIPPDIRFKEMKQEDVAKMIKLITEVGVPWKPFRELAELRCRKVFLLDTCFAGNVLLNLDPERHLKSAIRPISQHEILVVSATGIDQSALEATGVGHGFFSLCLIDGIGGKAVGRRPDQLQLHEVVDYVEREVPSMTHQMQTPRSSPKELLELMSIPISRPTSTKASNSP